MPLVLSHIMSFTTAMAWLVCALVVCLAAFIPADAKHTTVVLMGATGDLAKKYLWQSFFDVYRAEIPAGHTFSFHAGARSPSEKGVA